MYPVDALRTSPAGKAGFTEQLMVPLPVTKSGILELIAVFLQQLTTGDEYENPVRGVTTSILTVVLVELHSFDAVIV